MLKRAVASVIKSALAERGVKVTLEDATHAVDAFYKLIHTEMLSTKDFYFPDVGRLYVKTLAARGSYNIHTKENRFDPAKNTVRFKMTKSFKEELNG